ncbi:hypothetical protein CDFC105_64220 [Clostridioides difficile]|nr:hypothetical protein CDFC105_64220 [Clostridioides difficile]
MTQKYRYPTFLESISTILVMVVVVVIGFVFFNVPIQILLLISSAYAALIAHRAVSYTHLTLPTICSV